MLQFSIIAGNPAKVMKMLLTKETNRTEKIYIFDENMTNILQLKDSLGDNLKWKLVFLHYKGNCNMEPASAFVS